MELEYESYNVKTDWKFLLHSMTDVNGKVCVIKYVYV